MDLYQHLRLSETHKASTCLLLLTKHKYPNTIYVKGLLLNEWAPPLS